MIQDTITDYDPIFRLEDERKIMVSGCVRRIGYSQPPSALHVTVMLHIRQPLRGCCRESNRPVKRLPSSSKLD
jgi:hypothetical protein